MNCPDVQLQIEADGGHADVIPVLGQRATRQRKLIYDILMTSDDHLDVETLSVGAGHRFPCQPLHGVPDHFVLQVSTWWTS